MLKVQKCGLGERFHLEAIQLSIEPVVEIKSFVCKLMTQI